MEFETVSLKEFILTLMAERDRRNEARFKATDDLNIATATASKEAILKAEQAQAAHNTLSSNLRSQLEAHTLTLLPRAEADARLRSLGDKIDALAEDIQGLRESRSESTGRGGGGATALWGYLVGAVGLVSIILSIVFRFIP